MMYVSQLENCCSVLELGNFDGGTTKQEIFDEIFDYYKENNSEGLFGDGLISKDLSSVFIATTVTKQATAEKALIEAGFKRKRLCGRHAKTRQDKYLSFWMRTSIPKEVMKMIREYNKNV